MGLGSLCSLGIAATSTFAGDGAIYLAVPLECENPHQCEAETGEGQALLVEPADPIASPFGWHDTDGATGPESTLTVGNNVRAQEDLDANNSGGLQPDGGPSLLFDFPADPDLDPLEGTNLEAGIVNLFTAANLLHDLTYHYGFDEAAGNFQENNYGRGGLGTDALRADAQDGMSTNSSTFATPPDGSPPRIEMFRWQAPPVLTVDSPADIAGDYAAGLARFGAELDGLGVGGTVVQVDDGVAGDGGGTVHDGCEPLPAGSLEGLVGMVERGFCEFGTKVLNLENAGAVAGIVINNQQLPNGVIAMGAGQNGIFVTIPSLMIGAADGALLLERIPDPGVAVTLRKVLPNRDGALDNGIIAHEFGHGISRRLTGGADNAGCLFNMEQAGEGWSDLWTLVLSARAEDTPTKPRGIATYLLFEEPDGPGLRQFPYTTDLALNPLTYGDLDQVSIPHGVGTVWMSMLWEIYWELVAIRGFDPDLARGSGGNNLLVQLVVDGMKLQPCEPSFVDARNAILLADLTHHGGAFQCQIWRGFAKRGLGLSAEAGSEDVVGDEIAAFDVPAGCEAEMFADGFESGDCAAWSAVTGGC